MNNQLHYPFSQPPEPQRTLTVAPGVRWLRMALPFALDHINLWLLEDGEGWTLVDCGIGLPQGRRAWEQVIATELQGKPLRRIVVTHYHPDHIGQAGWLSEYFSAPVYMTAGEWALASELHARSDADAGARQAELFIRHGLDRERAKAIRERGNSYRPLIERLPREVEIIREGDVLRIGEDDWRVMIGRGHAPEHAMLYCAARDLLIAGDQILPTISSNVSVGANEADDPLADFIDSLQRLAKLPAATRVLPAHGLVFEGVPARAAALIEHHRQHFARIVSACAEPKAAAELLTVMFRRELDLHTLMFGMGETIAHLQHMTRKGMLVCHEGEDGVLRYTAA